MVRITIELIPLGYGKPQRIASADVINTGKGTLTRGEYRIVLRNKRGVWKKVEVYDFPRKKLNIWHLLFRALKEALDD